MASGTQAGSSGSQAVSSDRQAGASGRSSSGISECILGVVIGDDNQFLYALLCHFMDLLLCMHLLEFLQPIKVRNFYL